MQLPAHIRRRQGACTLEDFIEETCRQTCPVTMTEFM